jgi:hypothetical protein
VSAADFLTLKMEAIHSSETSVTQRHIPEDDILHSHRLEKLKSYTEELEFPFSVPSRPSVSCSLIISADYPVLVIFGIVK